MGARWLWGVQVSFLLTAAGLLTGCASGPPIDWDSRLNNFTYDQAVLDMGPPDKLATLTNGTKVGEWLTSRGVAAGFAPTFGPVGTYPYPYGPGPSYYTAMPSPDRYLRLTFSADGKLTAWRRVYH